MLISIPYGETHLEMHLPDDLDVTILDPRETAAAADPERTVHDAIETVDWTRFEGARTAAIAINDKTSPVPHNLVLPPLLQKLEATGIARERITLIIATGYHPAMKPQEYPAILPPEIIERYRITSHNIDDEDNIVRLGFTKKRTLVSINRAYFDANVKLVVGTIGPHPYAGFSGGAKTAVIGLAGWDTINSNHRMMSEPNAQLGHYEDNPVRQDIEDMGRIIGVHLALNTVLNRQNQIVRVFCGPPLNVMRVALPLARQVYELPVEAPFDLTIVSPGGHPKDINVYQAQKALGQAALITRRGGAIIVAAACPEGAGSAKYESWLERVKYNGFENRHQAVLERFRSEGFHIGPHKAYQIARDSIDRRVIWVTDLLDPAKLLMENARTLDEAVARVLDQPGMDVRRIGVIPYANATIPALKSSQD